LVSWTLSFSASALYQYWTLPVQKRWIFERPALGRLLRFGAPLQVAGVLWFLFGRVQTLLLGAWSGPTSVAYFAVASRIPDALQQVAESYMAVYFPRMTALRAAGRDGQATEMLNVSLRLVTFGAAAIALTGSLFSTWATELLFSDRYTASAPAFAILLVSLHMVLVVNLLGYTLTAAGRPQRSLVVDVVRTGVLVGGSIALIPLFGFMGAAYARLVSSYIGSPVVLRLVRRDYPGIDVPPCVRQTLILIVCAAIGWWADALAAKLAVGVAFLLASTVFGTLSRSDLALVLPLGLVRRRSQPTTGEVY
jgi:O-antigen/teichoic acid export membrane protein